jgi:hypothetical protein
MKLMSFVNAQFGKNGDIHRRGGNYYSNLAGSFGFKA